MTEKRHGKELGTECHSKEHKKGAVTMNADERVVLEALEEARQNVKSLVKKEMVGETLTGELLNFRLKVHE